MAKFYGTVQGGRGKATRLGHNDLRVSAQSYSGSVIVQLYQQDDEDKCRIMVGNGSTAVCALVLYEGPIKRLFSDQTNLRG